MIYFKPSDFKSSEGKGCSSPAYETNENMVAIVAKDTETGDITEVQSFTTKFKIETGGRASIEFAVNGDTPLGQLSFAVSFVSG